MVALGNINREVGVQVVLLAVCLGRASLLLAFCGGHRDVLIAKLHTALMCRLW